MSNYIQPVSEFDIDDFCSDELLEQILQELRTSREINCTHLPSLGEEQRNGNLAADAAATVGFAAAAGVTAPTIANTGLTAVGFTNNGIATGSMAAKAQSYIGNVARGSWFAKLQSTGAKGGFTVFGPLGIGIGAALVAGTGAVSYLIQQRAQRRQQEWERENERQRKIFNGTAEKDADVCEKCWIKMKLRNNNSR